MSIPKTSKSWFIETGDGFEALKFKEQPIPELGDTDVLVKFHYASLNYRDLIIPKGYYPFPHTPNVVPGSCGAGEVVAVGKKVFRFQVGSKVVTQFNQKHIAGPATLKAVSTGLGGALDGTLRQYGTFNEEGLVDMPSTLTYQEASSLTCAGVTAWNGLYGLKPIIPGQYVLTQGTGGVSIFALQFAKAAGAKVIATTSSPEKAALLKKLGADHVINYKDEPEWGAKAKSLTPNGEGVDQIIEVAGPTSMAQNFNAIKMEGVISIIGFLGGVTDKQPSFMEVLSHGAIVRGIMVGSRVQFEEMNRVIDGTNIKPVIDEKVFKFEEVKEAYQYMWEQKHFGKVTIKIE